MLSTRTAMRSTRAIRVRTPRTIRNTRFQSTQPSGDRANGLDPALKGGLTGAAAAIGIGYAWYHFSGAKDVVQTAKQTRQYFQSMQAKVKEKTPEPNEAIDWLRSTATSYAKVIPGASGIVNSTFDDLDTIRAKHGNEVDEIVRKAYEELRDVSGKGVKLQTAQEAWDVLQKYLKQIGELASDAASDILDNHPALKEKVGGNLNALKQMGDKYGPEAKKQVDQTWDQIRDILRSGISADTATQIRNLVQEKTELLRQLGDEAWQKGMEQAKPYLDKNPKVKELVEKNANSLRQGNFGELLSQIKQAVESGNTEQLQNYVRSATEKAKQSGMGSLDKYLNMIPGGSEIIPRLSHLQEVAQKHGKEAEQLMRETVDEVSSVLSRKSEQAKKLVEKAERSEK